MLVYKQMVSTEDNNVWYHNVCLHRCYLLKTAMCNIRCLLYTDAIYWRQQCAISDACLHRCYLLKTAMCNIRCLFTNMLSTEDSNVWHQMLVYTQMLSTEDGNVWYQMLVIQMLSTKDSNVWHKMLVYHTDVIYWRPISDIRCLFTQILRTAMCDIRCLFTQMLSTEDSNVLH